MNILPDSLCGGYLGGGLGLRAACFSRRACVRFPLDNRLIGFLLGSSAIGAHSSL
jgi:hypothetical protein